MQNKIVDCVIFFVMVQSSSMTRDKDSPSTVVPPDTLTFTVMNGDEAIILNWKRTKQYLANNNLPIWFAWTDKEPELIPDAIQDLGAFIMYHDVEKSSAVVYSAKSNCLYGVIDTRFYIDWLPLQEAETGKSHYVDGLYVKSRLQNQADIFHDSPTGPSSFYNMAIVDVAFIKAFVDDLPHFNVRNINPTSPIRPVSHDDWRLGNYDDKVQEPHQANRNVFYAEILIFISNEIAEFYKADQHNLFSIVLYYLVHFNAIDMLFAKLQEDGVVIHLNIAGLVLEAEKLVFPHVFQTGSSHPSDTIDAIQTSDEMGNYIRKHEKVFTEDSFDFFYFSTSKLLSTGQQQIHGIAHYEVNVYEFRKFRTYRPYGTVVSHRLNHGDYAISAHEVAHLFDVNHDPRTEGRSHDQFQCYAILQEIVCYCKNCLKWSERSRKYFQRYVSMNLNRCYLLNSPRSLQPYGDVIVTLSPTQQCDCYGYQSHIAPHIYLDAVGSDECRTNLACVNLQQHIDLAIPKPIDGTPCDIDKVCWQDQCRELSTRIREKGRKMSSHRMECHMEKQRTELDSTIM